MTAYVGEIRMFAGNFPPNGWMFCDGSTLPISENDVLFTLIGTTYGGDGESTFNIPNLQSRVPMHKGTGPGGNSYQLGEMAGTEMETLTVQQIPSHSHPMQVATGGQSLNPTSSSILATATGNVQGIVEFAAGQAADQPLLASAVGPVGGSQPHENTQPFLCINFIIALFGIYPSPS